MMDVKIEESWKDVLKDEFRKEYFKQIVDHIKIEKEQGKIIYPPGPLIFNAFQQTPFNNVKVVLIGQDPYHNPKQAMGLSFSVPDGVPKPPSLINIFKELQTDTGTPTPQTGNLTKWAQQGVLLLNASLTVRANEPNSHAKIGWHQFTDTIIEKLSQEKQHLVFLLWGRFAQDKTVLIDTSKHLVLKAAHPSPFAADKGFFGCGHFCKTNNYLASKGIDPVDWAI